MFCCHEKQLNQFPSHICVRNLSHYANFFKKKVIRQIKIIETYFHMFYIFNSNNIHIPYFTYPQKYFLLSFSWRYGTAKFFSKFQNSYTYVRSIIKQLKIWGALHQVKSWPCNLFHLDLPTSWHPLYQTKTNHCICLVSKKWYSSHSPKELIKK